MLGGAYCVARRHPFRNDPFNSSSMPSVLPILLPWRVDLEPLLAQEASYLAASARIANLPYTLFCFSDAKPALRQSP